MTANSPPNHARTAAEMLQQGEEALMLRYLLNQQARTSDCWTLPDGSSVSWDSATGCYRFVSPDGTAVSDYAGMWPSVPYVNIGYLAWHLLKLAETEAGADAVTHEANDPLVSEAEAMTICPQLNEIIRQALDTFEPDEDILSLVEQDTQALIDRTRDQIPPEGWNAILSATTERARPQP